MSETSTASVDREACKGHGRCYMTDPDVFDSDDDGFPIVIGAARTPAELAELDRAVNNCPERAITVVATP
ncbi:ferredoxin [Nocardioides daeguensis]|uniref:Ferredoxin n=1 Tax=Nocardioides daeguensis TaxID=908359 RepID=A0ABP6V6R2_9ACTN|nr:ferredoxin [Nocardioides daeguensis]MBV6726516.1 ferredoxin [Nocardioides daeguensis]MCR1772359.1 ferredoxin [Nocardioides daeguensis]